MKIPSDGSGKVKISGYKIHYTTEIPDAAKAHIIFVHGMGEHSARYTLIANYFLSQGFAYTLFDLPGHGKSSGLRGDVLKYSNYYKCINHFKCLYPQLTTILFCHSMGGNIGLNYLLSKHSKDITCASVGSPWIQLAFKPSFFKAMLAVVANKIAPRFLQKTNIKTNFISRLPEEVEKYKNDKLIHSFISPRLFTMVQARGLKIKQKIFKLSIPVFLYHGTADCITSFKASQEISNKSKFITFKAFENCYHEVHHEAVRNELLNDLLAYYKLCLIKK